MLPMPGYAASSMPRHRGFKGTPWSLVLACLPGCATPTPAPPPVTLSEVVEPEIRLIGWRANVDEGAITALVTAVGGTTLNRPLPDVSTLVFPSEDRAKSAEERLAASGLARWVSRNHRRSLGLLPVASGASAESDRTIQSFGDLNTGSSNQWGLAQANIPAAWQAYPSIRGQGVLVGVLDSGVDYRHPDLALNMARDGAGQRLHVDAIEAAGRNDSCLGLTYSYATAYSDASHPGPDGNGHGTHVAGIIGAVGDNQPGLRNNIVGVAPSVRIVDIKAMDCQGGGTDDVIALGIRRAVDLGVRVLNMSIGGEEPAPILAAPMAYGQARGVLFVVAAGNGSGVPVYYPAAYAGVLAVGALDPRGRRASYGNIGPEMGVVAAGGGLSQDSEGILSTLPTYAHMLSLGRSQGSWPGHGRVSGTSQASPLVAGLAALILSQEPGLSADQVRLRILASATDVGTSGFDPETGWGRVDALAALGMQQPTGSRP